MRRTVLVGLLAFCGCQQVLGIESGSERVPAGGGGGAGASATGGAGGSPAASGGGGAQGGFGGAGGRGGEGPGGQGGGVGGQGGVGGGVGGGQGGCADPTQRIAFLSTSPVGSGTIGVGMFDAHCQAEAAAAGCGKTFRAWVSSFRGLVFDASTRIAQGVWYLPNGTLLAADNAGLLDGSLDAQIRVHADGSAGTDEFVFTGTAENGTSTGLDCSGWLQDTAAPTVGWSLRSDQSWTDHTGSGVGCSDSSIHLYCFEAPP